MDLGLGASCSLMIRMLIMIGLSHNKFGLLQEEEKTIPAEHSTETKDSCASSTQAEAPAGLANLGERRF